MMPRIGHAFALTLLLAAPAFAQTPATAAPIDRGKTVYQTWCTPCHGSGRGFPGTAALAAKYKGQPAIAAVLEDRTDLTPAAVKLFVRRGVSVMPFFRKTEITDADLDALTTYLSNRNAR
jgi:mono/diheme cytochrome c family protein